MSLPTVQSTSQGNGWNVVLQVSSNSRSECVRFSNLPVDSPAHIAIVSDGTATASGQAKCLFDSVRQAILNLEPGVLEGACDSARLLACKARAEPRCISVLLVVGSGTALFPDPSLIQRWLDRPPCRVIPVLPDGMDPSLLVGTAHERLGVLFHPGDACELAPEVLAAAAIGGARRRLFVSYRRKDAQELVNDLHQGLSRLGWDLFVDRFHGVPGRDFARKIVEELGDKSVVLVIESRGYGSRWTLAEIRFAAAYRLGLLAVHMPGAATRSEITARDRHELRANDLRPGTRSGGVRDAARDRIIAFVRDRYAYQQLRRRLYLDHKLRAALAFHRAPPPVERGGVYKTRSGSAARTTYAVRLAERPTHLPDVRRVCELAGVGARRVVIGPADLHPPEVRSDVAWLANSAAVTLRRETSMLRVARDIASGAL